MMMADNVEKLICILNLKTRVGKKQLKQSKQLV